MPIEQYFLNYDLKKAHNSYYRIEEDIKKYLIHCNLTYSESASKLGGIFYYGRYPNGRINHTEIYINVLCEDNNTGINIINICNYIYISIIFNNIHKHILVGVTRFDVRKDGNMIGGLDESKKLVWA